MTNTPKKQGKAKKPRRYAKPYDAFLEITLVRDRIKERLDLGWPFSRIYEELKAEGKLKCTYKACLQNYFQPLSRRIYKVEQKAMEQKQNRAAQESPACQPQQAMQEERKGEVVFTAVKKKWGTDEDRIYTGPNGKPLTE